MDIILADNAIIAEFIGMQKTDIGWYDNREVLYTLKDNTFDTLLFHRSWDWLMPIIEYIENINTEIIYQSRNKGIRILLKKNGCHIEDSKIIIWKDNTENPKLNKLDMTISAISDYIQKYNSEVKKHKNKGM